MKHWTTRGLIRNLAQVTENTIAVFFRQVTTPRSRIDGRALSDRKLVTVLLGIQKINVSHTLDNLMLIYSQNRHGPGTSVMYSLSALLAKFQDVVEARAVSVYTEDTAMAFHCLLVGTLMGYAISVNDLHIAMSSGGAKEKQKEGRKMAASRVGLRGLILQVILHSKAFEHHLLVLAQGKKLNFPLSSEIHEFTVFAANNFGTSKLVSARSEREEVDDVGRTDDNEWAYDGELDAEAEEQSSLLSLGNFYHRTLSGKPAVTIVEGWMRTFIGHFRAQRILEHHCSTKLNKNDPRFEVQVDLIVVQGNKRPVAKWEKMESIIRCSLSQSDAQKTSTICMFIEEINKIEVKDVSYASRSVVSLFKTLTKGLSNPVEGGGGQFKPGKSFVGESFEDKDWSTEFRDFIVHCEAALASYAKYGDLAVCATTGDEMSSLKDLSVVCSRLPANNLIFMFDLDMKKLDQAVVAVCKLCCPTCMELFHVLRNGVQIQENLWVRGHHSTVFPVELPDWLPADVLQDMVLRYRQHLSEALQRFSRLKHVQLRHGRRPMYSASARPLNEEKNLGIPSEYITT